MIQEGYDYIIVGAGSAGCVLANRLSANPDNQVLLIEAGGSDRSIFVQMPAALAFPMNKKRFNWFYYAEAESTLNGRRLHCPRGKVLGGSSSINGMVYIRGNAMDFEHWEQMGAKGWRYQDVLPYFIKAESHNRQSPYRGQLGPLKTTLGTLENPLYQAFIEAGGQAGYPLTEDVNGFQQEGFGPMDMTVDNGVRCSTARAYLQPILDRKNLHVATHTMITRVIIEKQSAIGVEMVKDGRCVQINAQKEVILSAGAINSPQLLMLSGIGDARELEKWDIPVVHHNPNVGAHLQDHLELYVQYECKQPITLYKEMNLFSQGKIGAQWLFQRKGIGASNQFEAGAFIRSFDHVPWPDIQYHFLPAAITYDGKVKAKSHGFQAHVGPMRSKSHGKISLRSQEPNVAPRIQFNYMSHPEDWQQMRRCIEITRDVFSQKAFDPYRKKELAPGTTANDDKSLDEFIQNHVESAYHPCGTCRMGEGEDAVVDSECRVHGIDNLRVIDSSIMPQITNGNLNAPTIMIAEKAAAHMTGALLKPSTLPFYQATTSQLHTDDVASIVV